MKRQADENHKIDCPLTRVEILVDWAPGESYRRRLRSLLLYLCDVYRALINEKLSLETE